MKTLRDTFQNNYRLTHLLSRFLSYAPGAITSDMMKNMTSDRLSSEESYAYLLSALFGMDMDQAAERKFFREYLAPSIRRLNPDDYRSDPYFARVGLEARTVGRWELKWLTYPAYRGFTCGDPILFENGREIQQIGYFDQPFSFPAVLENGNEWMTLTPVDMETVQNDIRMATGNCITFGLGLGYYAFSLCRKPQVSSVTVVERSDQVIRLFREELLQKFDHAEKLHIIQADAFEYAENEMPKENFDHAFVDTWRDAGDGLEHYLKMKPLARLSPHTTFSYWIEKTILSRMRAFVWEQNRDGWEQKGYDAATALINLQDEALAALAAQGSFQPLL